MDHDTTKTLTPLTGPGIRSITRNAFFLMGSHWANILIRLCYVVFLARWLGPELYGLFNYAMSWYMVILPLSGLGLGVILGHEIPRNPDRQSDSLSGTFSLRVISAVSCAVFCAVTGLVLEKNPEARQLLLVFSSALVGRSLAYWASSAFTAYEASQYAFVFRSSFRILELVFSLLLIYLGGGILALSVVHGLSWWAEGIFSILWIKNKFAPVEFRARGKELRRYFRQGLLLGIMSVSQTFILQGPLIIYRYTSGLGDHLGQLALAMQALILMASLPGFLTAGALPALTRSFVRNDGKAQYFTETMIGFIIISGTFLGLLGLAVFPWFVKILFGPFYGEAGILLGWIFWLLVPLSVMTMINGMFQARGEYAVPALFSVIAAGVLLLCIYPMISLSGPAGVMLSLGISLVTGSAGLVVTTRRKILINTRAAFFKPLMAALAASLTFFIWRNHPFTALFGSFAILLAGTVLLRILSPEEISAMRLALKSLSPSSEAGGNNEKGRV